MLCLAKHCINIYFEQTQWQQAADAKRYPTSIIYVFHSLSVSPSSSPSFKPPNTNAQNLHFTQECAQAYTLAMMYMIVVSTEELHECTHNCLFDLTETTTLATHSKMAPSVLFRLSLVTTLNTQTRLHTFR